MAYDAFGNYMGDYGQESSYDRLEEERKRREQEEQRQRDEELRQANLRPVAPVAPVPEAVDNTPKGFGITDIARAVYAPETLIPKDISSIPGQMLDQRLAGVQDRISDLSNPAQALQSRFDTATQPFTNPEEALRRRVGLPAPAVAPVAPDEVVHKQQVETRADGSQVAKTTQEIPAGTQPRQPGFVERAVNAMIPSAQAGTLPPQTPAAGAQAFPVQQPAATQFRNLANSAAADVAYQPPEVSQAGAGRGFVNPPLVNAPVAPEAGAGRGFVNPPLVNAPVAPGSAAQVSAIPGESEYDRAIRTQESGARPDIGYHYAPDAQGQRRSSAYGAYGITAPTYAGIQKADPYFQGRDITSLTPEEQARANQVLTRQNSQQLTNYGIEPTQGNLAAAHFLGSKGLKDYMDSGYISPAAAAANGGEEKVREIVQRRMGGQYAPASGALEAPVPTPPVEKTPAQAAMDRYQAAQDDPIALLQLRSDDSQPEFIRKRAGERASDLMIRERNQNVATERADQLIQNGDQKGIAKVVGMPARTEEGSFLKAVLFARLGLTQAANEEMERWGGYGHQTKTAMNAAGDTGLIEYDRRGNPIKGTKSDGTAMSGDELVQYASAAGKASDVSGTQKQAIVDGQLHTFSTKKTAQGTMYRDDTAGTGWTAKAPEGLTHLGQQEPGHLKGLTAANSVVTKMTKANQDAIAATGRPQFSPDQIQTARNEAYSNVSGKPFPGAAPVPAGAGPVAPTAMPVASAQPTASPAGGQAPQQAPAATTAPVAATAPKTIAQQILDYEAPAPTGPTTATKIAIMNEVNRLAAEQGKTYDGAQYKIASKTRQDFTTGVQGKAVQSMNVAIDHLDTLQDAATALNNGKMPIFNDIAQKFAKNTGNPAPTNFDALKSIVGSEVAKAVTGGASALGDREEIRAEINKANSPAQLSGVINKYQHLMAGQVKGLKQTYESAGLKDFDAKLLPRTKYVLNKTQEPTRSSW